MLPSGSARSQTDQNHSNVPENMSGGGNYGEKAYQIEVTPLECYDVPMNRRECRVPCAHGVRPADTCRNPFGNSRIDALRNTSYLQCSKAQTPHRSHALRHRRIHHGASPAWPARDGRIWQLKRLISRTGCHFQLRERLSRAANYACSRKAQSCSTFSAAVCVIRLLQALRCSG